MTEWLETDGLGGFAMGTATGSAPAATTRCCSPRRGRPTAAWCWSPISRCSPRPRPAGSRCRRTATAATWCTPTARRGIAAFTLRAVAALGVRAARRHADRVRARDRRRARRARSCAGRSSPAPPATLWVRPLLAGRDYHALTTRTPRSASSRRSADDTRDVAAVRRRARDPCAVIGVRPLPTTRPSGTARFFLATEAARGLDCEEDLASPGAFTFELPGELGVRDGARDHAARWSDSPPARAGPRSLARPTRTWSRAAPARTVIAGYPWFTDWGRDTFISLRGLCLARDRLDDRAGILRRGPTRVDGGMLPNRFVEHATARRVQLRRRRAVVRDRRRRATSRAARLERRRGASCATRSTRSSTATRAARATASAPTATACSRAGEPGLQLTWMDAKVGDSVVTPRIGKPVEVQALWLNALAIAGRRRRRRTRPRRVRASASGTPARLLTTSSTAITSPAPPIRRCRAQPDLRGRRPAARDPRRRARPRGRRHLRGRAVDARRAALARAGDPRYRGRYGGGPLERDRAYHHGPVWPWLAGRSSRRGCACAAARRGRSARRASASSRRCSAGSRSRASATSPRSADGDASARAERRPFQAWSVAELIRLDQVVLR